MLPAMTGVRLRSARRARGLDQLQVVPALGERAHEKHGGVGEAPREVAADHADEQRAMSSRPAVATLRVPVNIAAIRPKSTPRTPIDRIQNPLGSGRRQSRGRAVRSLRAWSWSFLEPRRCNRLALVVVGWPTGRSHEARVDSSRRSSPHPLRVRRDALPRPRRTHPPRRRTNRPRHRRSGRPAFHRR